MGGLRHAGGCAFGRTVRLPDGTPLPAFGQGTCGLGERPSLRAFELEALRAGIEAGATLIDTAETYGAGAAEDLVGEAIRGIDRAKLFLVSKVHPENAGAERIFASCAASLERLGVNRLDLYLLHWRGPIPLEETAACMERLRGRGMIRHWGVSNFDVDDLRDLWRVPGGSACAANQVLYHLASRGAEYELLPLMAARGMPLMAYCPLAQGGALRSGLWDDAAVAEAARRHGATPAQVLLAFAARSGAVAVIPKAASAIHARENAAAAGLALDEGDLALLDEAFPPPETKMPLDMQ